MCRYASASIKDHRAPHDPPHDPPSTPYNPPQASSTHLDLPRPTPLLIKLFYGAAFDTFCQQHFVLYLLLCLPCPPLSPSPPLKLTARLHRQNKQKANAHSLSLFFAVLALPIQITANLIISYANRVCHKRACYGKTDKEADSRTGRQTRRQTDRQSDSQAGTHMILFLSGYHSLLAAVKCLTWDGQQLINLSHLRTSHTQRHTHTHIQGSSAGGYAG